jgi:tRNA pseudouridine32 synthase / 23S rRNA pseudouridine746 synthase
MAIPMRNGVSPSCIALPQMRRVPWPLLLDFLAEKLPVVPRAEWRRRMEAGEVVDAHNHPLAPDTRCESGMRTYYWRQLPAEPPVPFEERILFQDEHLLVADKPHFLPVTPGGRYVRETLMVRLKHRLNLPDLSPLHRIDRETAGLVLFSLRPQDRDAYQRLFRERRVHKTYEAIAPAAPGHEWPLTRRSHILEDEQAFYRMREAAAHEKRPVNAETTLAPVEQRGPWARYRLEPVTGQRHQLRVHMNALGLPIAGDQFYPRVRRGPDELEDYREPLQLLAQRIAFMDPVTGEHRQFESLQQLTWPDAGITPPA